MKPTHSSCSAPILQPPVFRPTGSIPVPKSRLTCALLLTGLLSPPLAQAEAPVAASAAELVQAGRAIYLQGMLPSGQPLVGTRQGSTVSDADAACINCHRRSGMGMAEGSAVAPPVVGQALFNAFRKRGERRLRFVEKGSPSEPLPGERPPYDPSTLARALRQGVASDGTVLGYVMPRYLLADNEMRALIAYLLSLDTGPSPGVDGNRVHIATVIAPETDPGRRKTFLDTLDAYIAVRHPELPPNAQGSTLARPSLLLHVWQLEGPAAGWEAQLRARYAEQPVFAVLSGLGTGQWAPVHRFCSETRLPCLMPNTDVPGADADDFYNFYFSRGVLLDARVLARPLTDLGREKGLRRVVQVSRASEPGAAAAAELRKALDGSKLRIDDREVPTEAERANWLADLGGGDALVLWLGERDLAPLLAAWPSPGPRLFLSARLAPPERLTAGGPWRAATQIVYGYELPGKIERRIGLGIGRWLARLGLPLQDAHLQGQTLAACITLTEAMQRLRGNWLRDYLVEIVESGMADHAAETVLLPRFAFGTGQRFASKGAYLASYPDVRSPLIAVEPELVVP